MSTTPTTPGPHLEYATAPQDQLLGHPKGLFVLFSTELWERFSFYAMRGILTLYMVKVVLTAMAAEKGDEAAGGFADQTYGAYLGFVYAATFVGGMLADRLLGQRRAIYIGGFLMALAQFTLTAHAQAAAGGRTGPFMQGWFYAGLALLACGNGFFKPNISTIVGTLYRPEDQRRDSAFTIFYMGINIGAFLASFMAGVAQAWGWYLGYALAGTGMLVSLFIFRAGSATFAGKGEPPANSNLFGMGRFGVPNALLLLIGVLVFVVFAAFMIARPSYVQSLATIIGVIVLPYLLYEAFRGTPEERGRMIVIIVLCIFSMLFWGFFELAGSTVTRFTERSVDRFVLGRELPAAFVANFINPLLIIVLCIPFSILWVWLGKRGKDPSSPVKFSLGIFQLGLGFLMLYIGALQATTTGAAAPTTAAAPHPIVTTLDSIFRPLATAFPARAGYSSLVWLVLAFLFHTTGELCLSPVGLSMITKLSPARLVGMFMGVWFLSSALANVITGGVVGRLTAALDFGPVFLLITATSTVAAILLFAISPILKRQMHGVN